MPLLPKGLATAVKFEAVSRVGNIVIHACGPHHFNHPLLLHYGVFKPACLGISRRKCIAGFGAVKYGD
jgi:hypothetical protein